MQFEFNEIAGAWNLCPSLIHLDVVEHLLCDKKSTSFYTSSIRALFSYFFLSFWTVSAIINQNTYILHINDERAQKNTLPKLCVSLILCPGNFGTFMVNVTRPQPFRLSQYFQQFFSALRFHSIQFDFISFLSVALGDFRTL